ncbi:MAG TPA: ArsA-related P-loop ATPase [Candidatus Limnocylindrales bacterium]|nr:ArsA-related P-loop ATPase [Candidatus Limnocylindrales bacterium]
MKPAAGSLAAALYGKRLVVLVGQGGVGKTSASAAIAYGKACGGAMVSVLTVDPAPRLGDALGIATIGADPQDVALPESARGTLTAMRLDTKRTFDRMIEENSSSAAVTQKLLAHPIYRAISEQLGGTENYMAFQRLHELVAQGGRDCLVVDTPPATNATELLSAPSRLAGLLDTGALSIIAEPARLVARTGGVLARATISLVIAAIGRVTGTPLQREVGQFVDLFSDLVGGLEGRARAIDELLRAPETAFVLVTRPREGDVADALAFRASLDRMGIRVAAVVANRVTPAATPSSEPDAIRLAGLTPRQRGAVIAMEADMNALRALERSALVHLRESLGGPGDPPVFELAARDVDVASLDDIAILARELEAAPK